MKFILQHLLIFYLLFLFFAFYSIRTSPFNIMLLSNLLLLSITIYFLITFSINKPLVYKDNLGKENDECLPGSMVVKCQDGLKCSSREYRKPGKCIKK